MSRVRPGDLTCRELVELVTDFIEDAMPEEERTRFEHHLVTCAGCVAYLRQMRATIEASGRAARPIEPSEIPEPTLSSLLAALRTWKGGSS